MPLPTLSHTNTSDLYCKDKPGSTFSHAIYKIPKAQVPPKLPSTTPTTPRPQHYTQAPALHPCPSTTPRPQHYTQAPALHPGPSTTPRPQHYTQAPALHPGPSTTPRPQHYTQAPALHPGPKMKCKKKTHKAPQGHPYHQSPFPHSIGQWQYPQHCQRPQGCRGFICNPPTHAPSPTYYLPSPHICTIFTQI